MRRTTVTAFAAVCVVASGCGGDGGSPQASPTGTTPTSAAPSATPTPAEAAFTYGAPFYGDDFQDESKGWTQKDTDTVSYVVHDEYAMPSYTVTVKQGRLHVFPRPEFRGVERTRLADYQVTAKIQTTLSVGHTDYFGVTCRDLDEQRYSLSIGYDLRRTGQIPWRILKHGPAGSRTLAEGTAASPGGSAFTVAGTCAGGQAGAPAHLVLTVNDTEVGRTTDTESPLTEGYGGVYAFSDDGKTTVNVYDFSVRPATLS